MIATLPLPPQPGQSAGPAALRALVRERSLLPALEAMRADLGPVFRLPLPGFDAVVLAGPEAARFVLVEARQRLSWRMPRDPVTRLLRHGLLVEDGPEQARLRELVMPALHRRWLGEYAGAIWRSTAEVCAAWPNAGRVDMLGEMRRVALLALARTVFGWDIAPELPRVWGAILRLLGYISPGAWLLWPDIPRPGYARARRLVDESLYGLIRRRRQHGGPTDDVPGLLVAAGLSDDLIRDQLLTLLIAGHDTSTALLAWALLALAREPGLLAQAEAEALALPAGPWGLAELERLPFTERALKETLRHRPPIHAANRRVVLPLEFGGYRLPAGTRLLFSIYLTHHDPAHWPDPGRFDPERFAAGPPGPYTYLPFGAGPRFCVGAALAQVEARLVLAYVLRHFKLAWQPHPVHLHMGATLEPRPGVRLFVERR